ncbi:hypothetical protein CPB85DRAFT_1264254 [Mucidula mucida]|nr:hypothetical protein CPB85DRAFT_1264254 [Mucidula mucida]
MGRGLSGSLRRFKRRRRVRVRFSSVKACTIPLKAGQAAGVAIECSTYNVGVINMGRGLSDVDGESVYASTRSSLVLHPLKASQAGGVANASQAGGVVNTLRECSTYNVGVINMGRGLSDVDGESVYASARSRPVLYTLKASQAAGVANTLRECSTYNVGVINMGRGLSDVDGESVYASARSRPVLYPLKAGQAAGVANTLRECSTYNVGVINMGRGLSDVDGESVYASARSRPVLYPLKAGQAGGVVNVNLGQALYGSLRCFKLVYSSTNVVYSFTNVLWSTNLCVRPPMGCGRLLFLCSSTNVLRLTTFLVFVDQFFLEGRQTRLEYSKSLHSKSVVWRAALLEVGWGFSYTWLKSCNKRSALRMYARALVGNGLSRFMVAGAACTFRDGCSYSMSQGEATTDVQSTFTEVDSSVGMYASLVDMGFHASWLDVQDVDGESVYASTGSSLYYTVEGWSSWWCGQCRRLEGVLAILWGVTWDEGGERVRVRFNGLKACTVTVEGWSSWWCGQYVDGESVYASTGSRPVLYPLKASQAAGVANRSVLPILWERVTWDEGERSLDGSNVDSESVLVKLVVWSMLVKIVDWSIECSSYTVGEGNMGRGLSDVDGESVDTSPGSSLVLYPLKGTQAFGRVNVRAERFVKKAQASQAGGVVNTLRECSTYTVGVINMGRGLSDVDGESVYASTGSSLVLYPSKAGKLVVWAIECSTYTVGEGNMGRGLSDVDGESVYASTGSSLVLYPSKAGQAGGVAIECSTYTVGEGNMGRGLSGSLRRFKLVKLVVWSIECSTYTVGESNTGRPAHALMTEDISGAGKGLYVPAWGQ